MANVIKHKRGSGSDPVANDLVVGELAIRTDTGKLFTKMDSGALAEIAGGGSDIAINTLSSSSGTGGGSATFNGSAFRFTLSSPPSVSAQQLLVSINGVIQKPVAGTGQPSEGFSVDGTDIILGDAPETGSDFFILTFRSLGVSVPADNSVTSAKIADGAIINADINASAAIAGSKISPAFTSDISITNTSPTISFVDSNHNPDFMIRNADGALIFNDTTNQANRLVINTDGHIDVTGNLDVGSGLDVTGAITGTGSVEIGSSVTNQFGHKLCIEDTGGSIFYAQHSTSGIQLKLNLDNTNDVALFGTVSSDDLQFVTANNNALRIDTSGNVGIGTTSPTGKLSIASGTFQTTTPTSTGDDLVISGNQSLGIQFLTLASGTSNNNIYFGDTDDPDIGMIRYAHADNSMQFRTNTNLAMTIDSSGNVIVKSSSNNQQPKLRVESFGEYGEIKADGNGSIIFDADPDFNANNSKIEFKVDGGFAAIIDSNKNVGIGTSSPSKPLHLKYTDNTTYSSSSFISNAVQIENDTTTDNTAAGIFFSVKGSGANAGAAHINCVHTANGSGALAFSTRHNVGSHTERMRIDSSGNVYFGGITSNPNGTSVGGSAFVPESGSSNVLYMATTASSKTLARFHSSSGQCGIISVNGTSTAYVENSDYRLKENETAISDGISRLKTLKPYRFNFKSEPDKTVDGFFAHEVSSVVPQAITGEKDAVNEDGSIDPQGIDHSKLVPLLVAALQEAIGRIEALEAN